MSRIWSEPYSSRRHAAPMPRAMGSGLALDRHFRNPTLVPHRVVLVQVCGFTFTFHTVEEVRACLEYYLRKILPSSRSAAAAAAVRSGEVAWRLQVERWYERLPLHLRKETKRVRVVSALQEALAQIEARKVRPTIGLDASSVGRGLKNA
jgi:hypothetical protein